MRITFSLTLEIEKGKRPRLFTTNSWGRLREQIRKRDEERLAKRRAAAARLPVQEQMDLEEDRRELMAMPTMNAAGGIKAAGFMLYMIGRYGDEACTGLGGGEHGT